MTQMIVRGPGQMLAGFDRDLDELFGLAFGGRLGGIRPAAARGRWTPACDVFTQGEDLVVRIDLPGIDPDTDVRVTVDNGVLCVRGERTLDRGKQDRGYYRRELTSGTFERAIAMPEGVRPEDITAHYANGVLDIVLPHALAGEPLRVPIDAGTAEQDVKELTADAPQA